MKKIIIIKFMLIGLLSFPSIAKAQWNLVETQDTFYCRYWEVEVTDDSIVFVGGMRGLQAVILRSLDLANSFDTTLLAGHTCYDITFPTNLIGYAAVDPSGIYKTTDGGWNWNLVYDSIPFGNMGDIFFINPDTGFYSYQDNYAGFYRTFDGGVSWTQMIDSSLGGWMSVIGGREMAYSNNALYLTGGNYFLKSLDYGANWDLYPNSSVTNMIYTINVINDKVWMAGMGAGCSFSFNCGILSQSINEGLTWNTTFNEYVSSFWDIKMVDEFTGYLVSSGPDTSQRFLKTTDGGISWGRQPAMGTFIHDYFYLFSVECINDSLCFAVGDYGTVFRTENGGGQATSIGIPENSNEYDVIIYPNPTTDFAIFEFDYNSNDNYVLIIYNSIGQEVKTIADISNGQVLIDAKSYHPGLYFCELRNHNRILGRVKLMIQ